MSEKLSGNGKEQAVLVGRDEDKLLDGTQPRGSHSGLAFPVQLIVDIYDLCLDVGVFFRQLPKLAEVHRGLLMFSDLDQPSWALYGKETEGEDDGRKVEVESVGDDPLSSAVV